MYKNLATGAIGVKTDLEGAIRFASHYGFEGIDFSIEEAARIAADGGPERVRELFASAGLRPGSWGPPVDWRGDEARYQEQLARLPALAALARQIGATRASTWVPPSSDDRPYDENFGFHVQRFTPIAEILRDQECRLGLEFIGPETLRASKAHPFIYTVDGMLDLCRAIGTGNMGLLLDCWHWYASGDTVDTLRRLRNDDVVVVHVNDAPQGIPLHEHMDNVRCLPGETGVIDLGAFMTALRDMGYDGPVTVEPFSARVRAMQPDQAVAETKASLDHAWQVGQVH